MAYVEIDYAISLTNQILATPDFVEDAYLDIVSSLAISEGYAAACEELPASVDRNELRWFAAVMFLAGRNSLNLQSHAR
jgi:hypothetical protein